MTLYVDTSALLKRYVSEHDSDAAEQFMAADPTLVTCRLTEAELRRDLARLLDKDALLSARRQVQADLNAFALVSIDTTTCNSAVLIAEQTLCRSLNALHVAAARRTGDTTTFLTVDQRQAQAARSVGLVVVGA